MPPRTSSGETASLSQGRFGPAKLSRGRGPLSGPVPWGGVNGSPRLPAVASSGDRPSHTKNSDSRGCTSVNLLIIDELSFALSRQAGGELFLDVVADHFVRRSTAAFTGLVFSEQASAFRERKWRPRCAKLPATLPKSSRQIASPTRPSSKSANRGPASVGDRRGPASSVGREHFAFQVVLRSEDHSGQMWTAH